MPNNEPNTDESSDAKNGTETQNQATESAEKETKITKKSVKKSLKEKWQRFLTWYKANKKLSIPLSVLVVLALLFAIPFSRYKLVGLFMKKDVVLYLVDSESKIGIVGNSVTIDGKKPGCQKYTTPYPVCFSNIPVGVHTVKVDAAQYQQREFKITVGVGKAKEKNIEVPLVSTGRTVSVRVINKISGKAVAGLRVKAMESEAITNDNGVTGVVVDPSLKTVDVEISGDGFNTFKTTLPVNTDVASLNEVSVTPAGKVYFLSKKSGKIDVVKTNLDGSERQTVLAGTGNEEEETTVLLASRDWKYLALLARRDTGLAKLYVIDTANDKLSVMDEGDANFTVTGWLDHSFVYRVRRNNVSYWQAKNVALKSFNAETSKITTLDENESEGPNSNDYASEYFGTVYALKGVVLYPKNWSSSYLSTNRLTGKQAKIFSVSADGSNKKTLLSVGIPAGATTADISLDSKAYEAGGVYYKFNLDDSLYEYEDGKVESTKEITSDEFYSKVYPTFLQSPDGKSNFWSEERDGKFTLFVGDEDGENGKEIASLSEFKQYGWFTDDYLLVSKNSSELYILSREGGTPQKITDYHKPVIDYLGYGGGYGGI